MKKMMILVVSCIGWVAVHAQTPGEQAIRSKDRKVNEAKADRQLADSLRRNIKPVSTDSSRVEHRIKKKPSKKNCCTRSCKQKSS